MESFENLWVKVEHKVLLLGELYIPVGYGIGHPFREFVAHDCVGNVYYPLARHFVHVSGVR